MTGNAITLNTGDVHAPGIMRNLDENGNLQFETALQISAGTPVEVRCDGDYSATGSAMYCRPCGNAYLVGVRLRRNRRREPRFEAAGEAVVAEFDSNEGLNSDVRHISLSGMGLVTGRQFRPQTLVRVETSAWVVFGEVRHCTPLGGDRYAVGIIFKTETFDKSARP